MARRGGPRSGACSVLFSIFLTATAFAQAPGEVSGVVLADDASISWDAEPWAGFYNVCRGDIGALAAGPVARCHELAVPGTALGVPDEPEPGHASRAPVNRMMWRKALITTLIAGVFWGIAFWLIESDLLTLRGP